MPFETDKLPLETILHALKVYGWEQLYVLQMRVFTFLAQKEAIKLIKDDSDLSLLPEGEPEKIPFGKVQVAVGNLQAEELRIVYEATRELLKVKNPEMADVVKKLKAPPTTGALTGGVMYSFGMSVLYPDEEIPPVVELKLSEVEKQINELRSQAHQAVHDNNGEKFYAAIDEAIRLAEANNIPPFDLKRARVMMFPPGSMIRPEQIISIHEEQLTYYREKGNIGDVLYALQDLAREMRKPEYRSRRLELMDEAIALAEQNKFPIFRLKRQRIELEAEHEADYERMLPYVEEELEYFKRGNDFIEQLTLMTNLATIAAKFDSQRALRYLDEADARLNSLTDADLSAYKFGGRHSLPLGQMKSMLQHRALQLDSLRRSIADPKSVRGSSGMSWRLDILPPLP
jgi:hypothetical protein